MKGRRKRLKPEKEDYRAGKGRQMWRVIDGAIRDAFHHHPDYLTTKGAKGAAARRSVAKRVTGAILSYLAESILQKRKLDTKQGRSGKTPASVKGG